ncbi:hypothetical protein HMPREF9333_00614 [Johnsonella ignava ATCC 51276]|uniref:PepSY domain-containing protein n=1 Tax=Johnsonella ignava ATCC 51276 TaxID=679200 RepID=G5GGC4_9FIRM|nr:PepSY domain-containing protein [Johnsonella ignava]EHI56334.1 hypothetical protein HMPREF9333_00614 [Johnsonella ignava ATCC 51276]
MINRLNRDEIEKKLDAAVSDMIPEDMFERISKQIVPATQERTTTEMANKDNVIKNKSFIRRFTGVAAAACILFIAGIIGVPYYGNNFVPDSHVDIDVNPGVEIITNKKDKVLDVISTNADGDKVIDGMKLKNTELKVAVNAIIGSMVQKGYMNSDNTGILVTVRNTDEKKAQKVRDEIITDINAALDTNEVNASVINQMITNDVDAQKFARDNNISIGKAVFVLNLAAKDPSLDPKQLASMKLSEIASLVSQKGINIRDIVDYDSDDSIWENIADTIEDINEDANENIGKAADSTTVSNKDATDVNISSETESPKNAVITTQKAKQIALAHAGLSEADVNYVKAELENDDGVQVYDIEFYSKNIEYDYDINAVTGEIMSFDHDIDDYNIPSKASNDNNVPVSETEAAQTQPAVKSSPAPTTAAKSGNISKEQAKQIALSHAGVSASNVHFEKVELDHENGILVYEVDFKSGNIEYDYDINASTGAIVSFSSEEDD